jgi:hypothetical protein
MILIVINVFYLLKLAYFLCCNQNTCSQIQYFTSECLNTILPLLELIGHIVVYFEHAKFVLMKIKMNLI